MVRIREVAPAEIEKLSFAIISEELGDSKLDPLQEPIIKRVIHTTADFDYVENLQFSEGVVEKALAALRAGAHIITDTNMVAAGVNKAALAKAGGQIHCFMANDDVALEAKARGVTRSAVCMEHGARIEAEKRIFALGNAPTAVIRLCELMQEGIVKPALVIGTPVGFVNVVEAKELLAESGAPFIIARGRKGGSNVAAAICNALLYMATFNQR